MKKINLKEIQKMVEWHSQPLFFLIMSVLILAGAFFSWSMMMSFVEKLTSSWQSADLLYIPDLLEILLYSLMVVVLPIMGIICGLLILTGVCAFIIWALKIIICPKGRGYTRRKMLKEDWKSFWLFIHFASPNF